MTRPVIMGAGAAAGLAVALVTVVGIDLAQRGGQPARVLTQRQVASYVRAADHLATEYVEQSWCRPMLAGTVGTVPRWPSRLATGEGEVTLEAGPPRGAVPMSSGNRLLDMSDVRSVLPPADHAFKLTPRFCVYQTAYPRLVTSGGRTTPSYAPLPHRLRSLNQIFDRFPRYLGQVTEVAVPVTVEVAYDLAVGNRAPSHFHLSWETTVAMAPTGVRRALRITSWALDAQGAEVLVQHDDPPGPALVRSAPPGSGP